jgi:hypothetical protein
MPYYNEKKSRLLRDRIVELAIEIKREVIVINRIDLWNEKKELDIWELNFRSIKNLRHELSVHDFKIIEMTERFIKIVRLPETD